MKTWNRLWKIELIEAMNPGWRDLYETLNGGPGLNLGPRLRGDERFGVVSSICSLNPMVERYGEARSGLSRTRFARRGAAAPAGPSLTAQTARQNRLHGLKGGCGWRFEREKSPTLSPSPKTPPYCSLTPPHGEGLGSGPASGATHWRLSRKESLARRGAARAGLRRRNPISPRPGRAGKREGGRGRRDVFRLSCLRRSCRPARQGTVFRLEPENGPLPASAEPSKEGENEPRGASVPAPKHTSARNLSTVPRAQGPALRHTPRLDLPPPGGGARPHDPLIPGQ